MNKTKLLTGATLLGATTIIGLNVGNNNVSATDYGKVNTRMHKITTNIYGFTSKAKDLQTYYSHLGYNRTYKTEYGGMYSYSPARPHTVTKGAKSIAQQRENNINQGNVGAWNTSYLLYSRSNYNFKKKGTNKDKLQAPKYYEEYGTFKGKKGEWRYVGYNVSATETGNVYFPSDYLSKTHMTDHSYVYNPWSVNSGAAGMFIHGSKYDYANSKDKKYKVKYDLVKKLLAQHNLSTSKKSVSAWMHRLSLASAPIDESALFMGAWNNNRYYVQWELRNETRKPNMMITKMTIEDQETGKVLGTFTRKVSDATKSKYTIKYASGGKDANSAYVGKKYKVIVTVKNLAKKSTKASSSKIQFGYKQNYKSSKSYPYDFRTGKGGDEFRKNVSKKGHIGAGGYQTYTIKNIQFDEDDVDKDVRLDGLISQDMFKSGDNIESFNDDFSVLPIHVKDEPGDLRYKATYLIDENENIVKHPIPGEKYKVRYRYYYTGPASQKPHWNPNCGRYGCSPYIDYWYDEPAKLTVQSNIHHMLPNVSSETIPETLSKYVQLRDSSASNPQVIEFTTPRYYVYQIPNIEAKSTISIEPYFDDLDAKKSNNVGDKKYNDNYDYEVSDLQVVPRTERVTTKGERNVVVSFDIQNTMPSAAKEAGYEDDVRIDVDVNGKQKVIHEHLKAGLNQHITTEMKLPDTYIGTVGNAKIMVNSDKKSWESDLLDDEPQENNTESTIFEEENVDENGGNDGENTSNLFSYTYDPTSELWENNTRNEWTQNYEVRHFRGDSVSYRSYSGAAYQFYKYRLGRNVSASRDARSQYEEYKIESILFRSKFTKDNKLGNDGWVEMMNADENRLPRIKAGYGYELKVKVTYKTNAWSNQPFRDTNISNGQGTSVWPYNYVPNVEKDLFVKTPDGKVLSVSGANNSVQGLKATETGDGKEDRTFEFTIKEKNTLGFKEAGKIYVGENTKDGKYGLEIWTPVISGVATKNIVEPDDDNKDEVGTYYEPSPLMDDQKVQFEVKGSAADDVLDSIIQ